jgi:hypothetical protein
LLFAKAPFVPQQAGPAAVVVSKAIEAESTSRLKALRAKEKQANKLERYRLSGPLPGAKPATLLCCAFTQSKPKPQVAPWWRLRQMEASEVRTLCVARCWMSSFLREADVFIIK